MTVADGGIMDSAPVVVAAAAGVGDVVVSGADGGDIGGVVIAATSKDTVEPSLEEVSSRSADPRRP